MTTLKHGLKVSREDAQIWIGSSSIDDPLPGSRLSKNCKDDKVLSTTSDCIVLESVGLTGEISSLEWSVSFSAINIHP